MIAIPIACCSRVTITTNSDKKRVERAQNYARAGFRNIGNKVKKRKMEEKMAAAALKVTVTVDFGESAINGAHK